MAHDGRIRSGPRRLGLAHHGTHRATHLALLTILHLLNHAGLEFEQVEGWLTREENIQTRKTSASLYPRLCASQRPKSCGWSSFVPERTQMATDSTFLPSLYEIPTC